MSEQKNTTVADVKRPNRQISVTVPAEFYDGFWNAKYTLRKEIGELFTKALEDFAIAKGIKLDGTAPHAPTQKVRNKS